MSKVLVTGGAGFIGTHLCRRLLARGDEVTCLDNFSTGSQEVMSMTALDFRELNVQDPYVGNFDEIYNLACPASPIHYQHDPVATTLTSVLGARNVLDVARECGAKVLQTSTSEVYGDPHEHPQTEDYWGNVNPIGPRSCYDEGKRCAEGLFFDYRRQYGTRIKVARLFNTYGPGMALDDGRVMSNFIVQALRGEALTVYGDGSQTRSFCYVDDIVEGLIRFMATDDGVTGPINLGAPSEVSIMALAWLIIKETGSKSQIVSDPLPQDDPVRRKPCIARAQKLLNWQATTNLWIGLSLTIDYFRKQLAEAA